MILVISGTNRLGSLTAKISQQYKQILSGMTRETVELFSPEEIQTGLLSSEMYDVSKRSSALAEAQRKYFIPATKWVIISPEYNGSYPGVLKVLVDALSVHDAEATFKDKKVALVGLSSGRAGNWLGMDQLTSVLQYLKMNVYHSKPALRQIESLLNDQREISDPKTLALLEKHAADFIRF